MDVNELSLNAYFVIFSVKMSEQDRNATSSEIRNFTEFLEKHLKRKVLNYTLKSLTKPGDNYGAILRSVDVKVAENGDSKVIPLFQNFHLSLVPKIIFVAIISGRNFTLCCQNSSYESIFSIIFQASNIIC